MTFLRAGNDRVARKSPLNAVARFITSRSLDGGVRLWLLAAVAVAPWWFAAVQARAQFWLIVAATVALAIWLVRDWADRSPRPAVPIVVHVAGLAIVLGLAQLYPLPQAAVDRWLPGRAGYLAQQGLEHHQADAELERYLVLSAPRGRTAVSLYPSSTQRDLALLLLGVAGLVLGAAVFRYPEALPWLLAGVAINGAAIVFFGLTQKLTWNGMLFWSVPLSPEAGPFGPFVNRNNAGGYLLICLGAALGLAYWLFRRSRSQDLHPLNGLTMGALSLCALLAAGVLATLSRGAALALVAALVAVGLLVLGLRWSAVRASVLAGVLLCLLAIAWGGMGDAVWSRLGTLFDHHTFSRHQLLAHWQDSLRSVPQFWPTGSGLGTYRYVYRPYQLHYLERQFYHAENQYVEAIVEGGVLGVTLLVAGLGLLALAAWRILRRDPDDRGVALGIAALFAVTAQSVAGLTDFGLHIPANLFLFAVVGGAAAGRAAQLAAVGRKDATSTTGRRVRWAVTLAALGAGLVWAATLMHGQARAETALRQTRFVGLPSSGQLSGGLALVDAALVRRPYDAELNRRRGQLRVALYQTAILEARGADSPAERMRVLEAASPVAIHAQLHQYMANGRTAALDALRDREDVKTHLIPALRDFVVASRACPLLADVHLAVAELGGLVFDPSLDEVYLARTRKLAPSDPDTLFFCGLLELQATRRNQAWADWQRSLSLSPRYLQRVIGLLGPRLFLPGVAEQVLPDSPAVLVRLARLTYVSPQDAGLRGVLLRRAEQALAAVGRPEQHYLQAVITSLRGDRPKAIEHYQQAVALDPANTAWRFELATALKGEGRLEEAREQALLCVLYAPNVAAYRRMAEQIRQVQTNAR